ncbi:MAG: gephyrin-like molybdotransferase Glp [Anaerolineales bacterium]
MTDLPQMLSVAEARDRILEYFSPVEIEDVPVGEAAGRVLARDMRAPHDLPPFANSSMDGFAVRAAEVAAASQAGPVTLRVSGDIPAGGGMPPALALGTAARIMTGAPVPAGADAVVPVEDTDEDRERAGRPVPAQVAICRRAEAGANLRPAGQDLRAGDTVVKAAALLGPASVGVLAALGYSRLPVYRRPRVAVFSTGDELRPVDEPLEPGQIHDSNSYAIAAAVAACGAEPIRLAVAGDRLEDVRARLGQARASGAQLIISSAGVSVGAYDVVRTAVEAEGGLRFWRVRMRPGKPLAFGQVGGVPFFGLPGNPVSALLTFEVFVRPAVLKLAGRRSFGRLVIQAALRESLHSDGRETYVRVVVEQQGDAYVARPAGDQGSAVMSTLVRANGLLVLPEGTLKAAAGDRFPVWLLDGAEIAAANAAEQAE